MRRRYRSGRRLNRGAPQAQATVTDTRRVPGVKRPRMKDLMRYSVNIPNMREVIWEPLYDFQTYPSAGQQTFTFFQNQIGVNNRTLSDTNIEISGQIPKGKNFLVTGIEVNLYPSATDLVDTTSTVPRFLRDYYNVMSSRAYLTITVGSKDYIRIAPLMKCPTDQGLYTRFSNSANGSNVVASYAYASGDPLEIVDVRLTSNQNFNVTVQFENVVSINNDARIGCTLRGYLFRNAQ